MRCFLFCLLPLLVLAAPACSEEPPRSNEPVEVETLKPQLTLETGGHTAAILMLFFSADGRQLVSVGEDSAIRFWDVESGELRRTLHVVCSLNVLGNAQAAALSADRRTLVLNARQHVPRGEKRALVFLDLEKGHIKKKALEVEPHGGQVFSLALSPDGKRLATGHLDGAYVWDAGTGQHLLTIQRDEGDTAGTSTVAFSPDGKRLAVVMAPWVHVVELATGRHEADFQPKAHSHSLAWSPDGTTLAVATGKGVELWDARAGTQTKSLFEVGPTSSVTWITGGRRKEGLLLTAGHLPGSRQGERGRVNLLDAATGQERHLYALPAPGSGNGQVAAFSPDGRLVAAALIPDNVIHLWRRNEAKLVWTAQGRGQHFVGAGWGKDGKTIAWGRSLNREADPDNKKPLEQAFDLAELRLVPGRPGTDFQRAVLSRDGITLNVRPLTVNRDGRTVSLSVPWRPVASGTLLPGNRAAFGSTLGPVYLVDTQTGNFLRPLGGHQGRVPDVAPSADGRYLLSAGQDQTLRVWDVATPGKETLLLSLFVAGRDWIAWTPGGYYAATPGGEKLMGWKVKPGPGQLATFYPAERFRKQLYRPDLIKLVLEKGSVEEALKATGAPAADVEQLLPPQVVLEVVDKTALPKVKAKATATAAARGQPVRSLRLLVDGRPLPDGQGVLDLKAGQEKAEAEWTVELPPGEHELKALARGPDTAGTSAAVPIDVTAASADERPTLHVIAVGIDAYPQQALQLKCAVADARGLADAFGKHCAGKDNLFGAARVKPLLNGDATRAAVLAALKAARQAVKPGDLLVFSFAGHGAKQGKQFYLLTVDADPAKLAQTALSGDDLRTALADLPCQVLLLLDACHSAAGVRAFIDEAARNLTGDECAVAVLCAAMGYEEAQEKDGHGLFTKAVIEALSRVDRVPYNARDGRQYVHHLGSFVLDEVEGASHGDQHPFLTMPYVTESFPVRQLPKQEPGGSSSGER
jgi:WD40 repeat protein